MLLTSSPRGRSGLTFPQSHRSWPLSFAMFGIEKGCFAFSVVSLGLVMCLDVQKFSTTSSRAQMTGRLETGGRRTTETVDCLAHPKACLLDVNYSSYSLSDLRRRLLVALQTGVIFTINFGSLMTEPQHMPSFLFFQHMRCAS